MAELSGYVYRCSAGETFDSISLNVYDSEKYAANLMNANPEYVRCSAFTGGEMLFLPVVAIVESAASAYTPIVAPWKE